MFSCSTESITDPKNCATIKNRTELLKTVKKIVPQLLSNLWNIDIDMIRMYSKFKRLVDHKVTHFYISFKFLVC